MIAHRVQLQRFLRNFKAQLIRNKPVFLKALHNVVGVYKKANDCFVLAKKDREENTGARWDTLSQILNGFTTLLNIESQQKSDLILSAEDILSILADIVQSYPLLIDDLVKAQVVHNGQ